MKKVKTLLVALFLIMASAFINACTCMDATITQVYETGISIRCTTDTVEATKNEETGELNIKCYKNDRFTIEYTLTPPGVTTTQVDWEFEDNSGILSAPTFTYSKSATESITFTANNKGSTVITFTTKATGKKAKAIVNVSEERGKLPTLAAPTNFNYNPTTGTVVWDHVTKVYLNNQLTSATIVDGKAKGLVAYKVTVSEYKYDSHGVAYLDPETTRTEEVVTNQYPGLELGKTYAIQVAAVGNDYDAKTGEANEQPFMFHQITPITDLKNHNGTITFTAPKFSAKSNLYCDGVSTPYSPSVMYPANTTINNMGGNTHTVSYSVFGERATYELKVIAYPRDYMEAKGYAEISNIRYYPSVESSSLAIKRFSAPEISLENVITDNVTVGGVVFNSVNTSSRLKLLGKDGEGINTTHKAKYQYFVLSRGINGADIDNYVNKIAFDYTGNYQVGSTGVTVHITADPAVDLVGGTTNTVFVRLVGDAATTVCSEWQYFAYQQLGKVYNPSRDDITGTTENGIDGLDIPNWSIMNNVISITADGVGSTEFYFANTTAGAPSKMVTVDNTSYNITDAGLAPGNYKIYARLVGQFTSGAKTLTGAISHNPIAYFQVLSAPTDTSITSDGTVKFKTVYQTPGDAATEIDRYTLVFTKGNTQTVTLAEGADLNESVDGQFIVPISASDAQGYRTFNIYDVARVILSKVENRAPLDITNLILNSYIESEGSFTYSLIANDNGTGSNVISSPATTPVNFTRVKTIGDISLSGSNSLKFATVSSKYVVIIETAGGDIYSEETAGDIVGENVVINLASLNARGGSSKILDYVGQEGQVSFRVYAIGGQGSTSIVGRLNSIETSITFECSAIPTGISMDPNGTLSWLSTTGREDDGQIQDIDASYQISFYVDGELKSADTKYTERSTGTAHEDGEHYIYSLDVADILAKYEGKVVGMRVLEIVSAKFAGRASDSFYTVKLNTVGLNRTITARREAQITWNAVNYATGYTLICTQPIFSGEVDTIDFASGSELSYQIPTDLNLGQYMFTVVAYGANSPTAGTEQNNPFIITSSNMPTGEETVVNPSATITVADGKLQTRAVGTTAVWKDIPGATYVVSYKLKSATEFIPVAAEDIISLDNTLEKAIEFADKAAGEYDIQILPEVQFVETGVILKDAGSISNLTKLTAVSNAAITTNQGQLEFTYETDKEVSIQLYTITGTGEGATAALISTSSYTETISEGKYIIDLFGIPSGARNIAIKVVSTGCLDSDLSTVYVANKITAVTGFAKVGEYLVWAPVEVEGTSVYATNYEIVLDGNNKQTLKVTKDGTDYICYILVDDGGTLTGADTPADATVFDYDTTNNVFKFKPEAILDAGQYTYKIKATITTIGYLNSNTASTTVTKLHNEVTVAVGDTGVFEYSAYSAIENNEPTTVVIKIARLKAVVVEGEEVTEGNETYEPDTTYPIYTATIPFSEYNSVTTDKGKYTIDIATLGLEGYDADALYGTTIQFIGNGGSIMDSEVTTMLTADKLKTTDSIQTSKGALTWSSVTSAEKYSVEYMNSLGQVVATFDYTVAEGEDVYVPSVITNDQGGVSNLVVLEIEEEEEDEQLGEGTMSLVPATTFTFVCDEIYTIRVMAKAAGLLNSKWSNTFSFKKLKPITNVYISRTDTIVREDGTIVKIGSPALFWENQNTEVVDLQVNYFGENGIDVFESVDPFQSSAKQYFELSSNFPTGTYDLRIQALGNSSAVFGLLNADMSEKADNAVVNYIASNTTPTVAEGKLKWSGIPSAYAYKIKFSNKSAQSFEVFRTGTELDLNASGLSDTLVTELGNGYWDISVTAVTDPELGIVSEHTTTEHTNTAAVYRPGKVGNYKVKNGMLSWTISYAEVGDYMARATLPEGVTFDISDFVTYVTDMAIKGESALGETYGSVPLEHFYKVNLNINGINTIDTPTEFSVLDASGNVVTDYKNGSMVEFMYDVSIQSDFNIDTDEVETTVTNSAGITYDAGYYEIAVNPVGDSSMVLDGARTGKISAYKLSTPKSWYDTVTIQVPQVDEFGEPVVDGEGNQMYDEVTSKNDIAKGKALWELSVINTTDGAGNYSRSYHKDYTLRAITKNSETRVAAKVQVGNLDNILDGNGDIIDGGERDPNIYDFYKYSKDIKEMFYDDEDNRIALDTVYRLFILANGTVDSTAPGHTGTNYLNSNTYMFSDTMTILTTDNPKVNTSQITWQYGENSTSTKLRIYGPLNIEDGVLNEDETDAQGNPITRDAWKSQTYTKEELALCRYVDGVDEDIAFAGISAARKAELIKRIKDVNDGGEGRLLEYKQRIKVIDLASQDGARATQYTLTDNPGFGTGGYAIYKQEIGDGRGVVDSPESEVTYAYKLGTTSATRQIKQEVEFANGTSIRANVDYWLGQNDRAGMFVWKPVPFANAYKLTLRATNVAGEGEDSTNIETVLDEILVYNQTYYEPESDPEYNKEGYKYSLDIVAVVVNVTGSHDAPEYNIAPGYFNSNNVSTATDTQFYNPTDATEVKTMITGRYFRLAIPTKIVVNDRGQISWNELTQYDGTVNNYAISYQGSNKDDMDATDSNYPQIDILNSLLGTISMKIKAIAVADSGYINSSFSTSTSVTKIAAPVPRVTGGVFEWGAAGDVLAGQSVTASVLTIDGVEKSLADNSVLSYPYFTEVNSANQASYDSASDESKYPAADHTITVMYRGTQGSSDDFANAGKQFYLASELKTYYVTKLPAPVLKNVINSTASEENRIYWNWNENAKAYKLKFFVGGTVHTYTIVKEANGTATIEINNPNVQDVVIVYNQTWATNEYFETDGTEIRFKLNALLKNISVTDTNEGLQVFAFAQAIGHLKTSTYDESGSWVTESMRDPSDPSKTIELGSVETYRALLSSSYSDRLVISIPSSPNNGLYDEKTGTLSWGMTNVEDVETGYNIILTAEYKVPNVKPEDFENWYKSANKVGQVLSAAANFAAAGDNTEFDADYLYYDEIKDRVLVYYQAAAGADYILYVKDTILVSSYKVGTKTMTPTSYKLTSVASEYKFTITATAYDSTETTSNSYKSATYEYNVNGAFALFFSGNGSPYIPYNVHNETELNNVRKYTDSHYKLVSDIYVQEKWTIIENFTGTITGRDTANNKNFAIHGLEASAYADGRATYLSFILNNRGTISNVDYQLNYTATSTALEYQVAGIAINNYGTLDNVNVVTYYTDAAGTGNAQTSNITITPSSTTTGVFVGGLVVDNRGIIKNSYVSANITALENGSSAKSSIVGGIARKMSGEGAQITNCYLKGEFNTESVRISGAIKSNYIGGIVGTIEESSTVSNSYLDETVQITVTDRSFSTSTYRGGLVGGIVAEVIASNVTIDKCYNVALIVVDSGSSGQKAISIGGILGQCTITSATNVVVSNSYVVARYSYAATSGSTGVYAYGIMFSEQAKARDCYYYVDTTVTRPVTVSSGTVNNGERVYSIEELKTEMGALGYITTTKYPSLG